MFGDNLKESGSSERRAFLLLTSKSTKQMKSYLLIISFSILTGFGIGCAVNSNRKLISACKQYNYNCEVLLDSIASQYSDFNDTVAETDAYNNYISSKHLLNYRLRHN